VWSDPGTSDTIPLPVESHRVEYSRRNNEGMPVFSFRLAPRKIVEGLVRRAQSNGIFAKRIHEDIHSVHVDALRMQVSSPVGPPRVAPSASLFRKFRVPCLEIMARSYRRFIHGWVFLPSLRRTRAKVRPSVRILHSSLTQTKQTFN